jgi:AAA+ ATPase superfamily predicted ATPase
MMDTPFYGRERELSLLKERLDMKIASLIVIKGRRRIGKSRLAEEFSKPFKTISIEGLPPDEEAITAQSQRAHFATCLHRELGLKGLKADDWDDLFWHLAQVTKKGRVILILDEINWMGSKDPTFLGKLKTAWDKYFKKNPQFICILSGSMSGWIEKNILSSTGFLGRISLDLTLEELPLFECNHFWRPLERKISSFEKFKILSVTGGIPRYLEEMNPKVPADEMIYRLCFRKEGLLFFEFNRIFSDLFSKKAATYKKIVMRLAHGDADLSQICDALEIEKGGQVSEYLSDLEETQYLFRYHGWSLQSGKKIKNTMYRLKDNYIRFYLKYIEPNSDAILKGKIRKPPAWDAIMALQFENLVVNHFKQLYSLLNILPDQIINDGPYFQRQTRLYCGCQIDYLLQLKYNSLYLCEIKYSSKPIDLTVLKEVQEKIEALYHPKIRFSIRPVLIHVNGVTDAVRESDFFTHIIDFSQFLYSSEKIK